jgi:hypothetical protein
VAHNLAQENYMTKVCALTDSKIKSLKPKEKPYQVFDGLGLYIEVMPSGLKYWRVKKMIHGRVVRRSLGRYPLVRLVEARIKSENLQRDWIQNADFESTKMKY